MSGSLSTIHLNVNGESHAVVVPPMKRLLDVLREDLHLTGAKEGCGEGECGSCSVRMNGDLVNSCLVPALQANGADIETVEGLERNGLLHPLSMLRVKRHGLLLVHIFPGLNGGNKIECMLVLRGCDQNRVNRFILQQAPEVAVRRYSRRDRLGLLQASVVNIGGRGGLDVGAPQCCAENLLATAAGPNEPNADAFVRSESATGRAKPADRQAGGAAS